MTYQSTKNELRISIIVPVYNEADHIAACLRSLDRQTVRPYEVIVVDNSSTDNTAALVAQFPFVTLLREPKRGVVYARDTGFNAARGDIIGRVDGDTVLPDDWVATVEQLFQNEKLDAVTGKIEYNDLAWAPLVNWIDLTFRRYFARSLGREVALQGSNMALRRSAWKLARAHTCAQSGWHEDFDLAVHLNWQDQAVRFDESLRATIGFRQTENSWPEFARYALAGPHTYAGHGLKSQWRMYPVAFFAIAFYVPLWILHHGYNAKDEIFSWRKLFSSGTIRRINPTLID